MMKNLQACYNASSLLVCRDAMLWWLGQMEKAICWFLYRAWLLRALNQEKDGGGELYQWTPMFPLPVYGDSHHPYSDRACGWVRAYWSQLCVVWRVFSIAAMGKEQRRNSLLCFFPCWIKFYFWSKTRTLVLSSPLCNFPISTPGKHL